MHPPAGIAFVIDNILYGGAQRQLIELIKGLGELKRYEIHLVCISLRNLDSYENIAQSMGVSVQYFPRKCKYDMLVPLLSLCGYISSHRIDLIHGFMNMGSLFGLLAGKITQKPVVCSSVRDAKDSSMKEKYLNRLFSLTSDAYVSNSKAGFLNRFKHQRSNFHVVYNGVDFSRFGRWNDGLTALEEELNIRRFSHVVGMVGALSKNKDQNSFLMAAAIILKTYPDAGFLLVGDGEQRPFLEKRTKALGLERRVVFAGYRSDVDRLYRLLDVCVLLTNSHNHLEGIPNVLIEAAASGIPVVASAGGGTEEIVEDGKTGILVPPGDPVRTAAAVIHLLSDAPLARSFKDAALKKVHTMFDIKRYAMEFEEIYRGIF